MTTKHTRFRTVKLCILIAVIIFVTSVLSDLSVKMISWASAQKSDLIGLGIVILAILVIALVVGCIFYLIPETKEAMLRMFGMDEPKSDRDLTEQNHLRK
jgi:uncharacterized BrkB/YihY/UPF0761 family membrane protein